MTRHPQGPGGAGPGIALVSTEGGILLSLAKDWPTSFFISAISFAFYVAARIVSYARSRG